MSGYTKRDSELKVPRNRENTPNMNAKNEWPAALRLLWLTGGLVALNEPESNAVSVQTRGNGRKIAEFSIPAYPALFAALTSRGFRIIGTTFITGADQLDGTRAIEFRAAALNGGWRLWDTFQAWRNIVAAAAKVNDMALLDISSRIATGLQFSEMRLYDLAMSYSAQLHGHLKNDEPNERKAFKDTFSPGVYKDIHALKTFTRCFGRWRSCVMSSLNSWLFSVWGEKMRLPSLDYADRSTRPPPRMRMRSGSLRSRTRVRQAGWPRLAPIAIALPIPPHCTRLKALPGRFRTF